MYQHKFTLADLKSHAKSKGYTVRVLDGEIECYPTGKRGDASYFETNDEDGRRSVLAFMNADREQRVRAKVALVPEIVDGFPFPQETREALIAWMLYHGAEWLDKLVWQGWYHGRYDGFTGSNDGNVSGLLQRLRNTNGHEVLAIMEPKLHAEI